MRHPVLTAFLGTCLLFTVPAGADEKAAELSSAKSYSPYAGRDYPTQVFWGDTHLHTALSADAAAFGNRLGIDEAYRFARGEEVVATSGQRVALSHPLDFLVVADHSDGYGIFPMLLEGDPELMKHESARRWHEMINQGGQSAVQATREMIDLFSRGKIPFDINDPALRGPVWEDVIAAAERYNEPGVFSAFIGYEWTSLVPPGNNLHRVVIYRDGGDKASQTLPVTAQESLDPEYLWEALSAYEAKTGGKILAIPHNANLSNGMMFALVNLEGQPLTRDYAERRQRWEPLCEVTQIKGDGETHPLLSPDDEFAEYETWDKGNLNLSEAKTPEMLQYEYGRSALEISLQLEEKLGVNPYKFGMIGSTDSHTSLASAAEEASSASTPTPSRARRAPRAQPTPARTGV